MGVSPRVTDTPPLLFTEVSPLCICHRLPRVATPILIHPLYRSLPEEGHRAVGINLAWYFNADTSNVPFGSFYSVVKVREGHLCVPSPLRNGRGRNVPG